MQDHSEVVEAASETTETTVASGRRTFLSRVALAGLGLAALPALKLAPEAQAANAPNQPEAESGKSYPQPRPSARIEAQYRRGVMPIANLSKMASMIAVDKASNAMVREFANFELRETIGVSQVLREMGTPVPPLSARDRTILQQLRALPRGAAFDAAYLKVQQEGHEFLRDLGESYIANSSNRGMKEMHGRHMAMLMLPAIKEHVVLSKRLRRSMV